MIKPSEVPEEYFVVFAANGNYTFWWVHLVHTKWSSVDGDETFVIRMSSCDVVITGKDMWWNAAEQFANHRVGTVKIDPAPVAGRPFIQNIIVNENA